MEAGEGRTVKIWTHLFPTASSARGGAYDLLTYDISMETRGGESARRHICILYHLYTAPPPIILLSFYFVPTPLFAQRDDDTSKCQTPRGRLVFLFVGLSERQAERTDGGINCFK